MSASRPKAAAPKGDVAELRAEITNLRHRLANAAALSADVESKLQQKIADLEADLHERQVRFDEQVTRNRTQEHSIEALQSEIADARQAAEAAERVRIAAVDESRRLVYAAVDKAGEIDRLSLDLRAAREEIDRLKMASVDADKLRRLEAQQRAMKNRLRGRAESLGETREKHHRAESALIGLAYRLGEAEAYRMKRENADAGVVLARELEGEDV